MRQKMRSVSVVVALLVVAVAASAAVPANAVEHPKGRGSGNSCWGEATAVFARMGLMGEHASQQEEPRAGLAVLARYLYDMGVISEPTLAALGAYLVAELGLDVDSCTTDEAAVQQAEAAVAGNAACWGQASAVFARMGLLGQHASQQSTPRIGLRNLARLLAEMGVIPDDSMASLGAFVAADLGLDVEACM